MKRTREALIWAAFLVLAGVFLLLRNLGIFAQWGDLAWGAIFALAGLGFLGWFLRSVDRWWRAIPAFMLLGIGAGVILQWRNIELGTWNIPLVLFGMALGFWAVLLVRREHWWALIPAGVLTVLAVELGLWNRLDPVWRMAVLYLGIGVVFLLLYAIRYEEADTRWAAIPAAAMLLFGLVTVMQSLPLPLLLKQWWPILLAVAGLGLGIGAFIFRGAAHPVQTTALPPFEALPPAPGASVTSDLPPAPEEPWQPAPVVPVAPEPGVPAPSLAPTPEAPVGTQPDDKPIDIYELIRQQPSEQTPPAEPKE